MRVKQIKHSLILFERDIAYFWSRFIIGLLPSYFLYISAHLPFVNLMSASFHAEG